MVEKPLTKADRGCAETWIGAREGGRMMRFAAKLASCALFVIAIVGAGASRAEDYPTHPVRIVIGFGAGASADTPARLLAQKFSDALGQQFIVENKPGAGSNVAAEYVARAPND